MWVNHTGCESRDRSKVWSSISYQIYTKVVSIFFNDRLSKLEIAGAFVAIQSEAIAAKLTSSTHTASLDFDEDIIITQLRKRNLDNGKLCGL